MILIYRIIFILLIIFVTWITLTVDPNEASKGGMDLMRWISNILFKSVEYGDKIAHFLAYSALGFFAAGSALVRSQRIWRLPLFLSLYGYLLEGGQYFLGNRQSDVLDGFANMSGAFSGVIVFSILSFLLTRFFTQQISQPSS